MDIITRSIKPHIALLTQILAFAESKRVSLYLVGGFLRDIYLGRSRRDPDIDFCMARGAVLFGRSLARHLKCGFVVLDEAHGCCRLVLRTGSTYTVDISDFRAASLADDLGLRDFTINTLCLKLSDLIRRPDPSAAVIDLYGARTDIERGRLRVLYPLAFDDDPLRLLRAFSLSALLGFSVDRETMSLIGRKKRLLARVSGERVRDEIFKILESSRACDCLLELDKRGILEIIFPEISPMKQIKKAGKNRIDVWGHTIATVGEIERLCLRMRRNKDVAGFLDAHLPGGRTMQALLKLCALFHDVGKPRTFKYAKAKVSFYGHERLGSSMVSDIARRLKLSNDEERSLRRITFLHLRPGYMATMPAVTARAIFRFFRDAAGDSAAILLLALADERATSGYEVVENIRPRYERLVLRLVRVYFKKQKERPRKRLLTGHDIMALGSLKPSEQVGAILRELDELQAVNVITTRSQAVKYAQRLIKKLKN